MRRFLVISTCLTVVCCVSQATVLHVSRHGTAQYLEVQAAINAASAGDTILIAPSVDVYASFAVDRRLTIIGAGYDTTTGTATIIGASSMAPAITVSDFADSTELWSLYIWAERSEYAMLHSDAMVLAPNADGILIRDCLIRNALFTSGCYFWPAGWANAFVIDVGQDASASLERCVLWHTPPVTCNMHTYGVELAVGAQLTMVACIVSTAAASLTGGDGTTLVAVSHCIFQGTGGMSTEALGTIENSAAIDGSIGSGPRLAVNYCVTASASDFIDCTGSNDPRYNDYHLSSNSVLRDAGNPLSPLDRDGSRADIGVYGGHNPCNPLGIPNYPFVMSLTVPSVVPQNGILNIHSTGRVGS